MKDKKLIRGIIYDNPNVVEEKTFETADFISVITDVAVEFYDKVIQECDCHTKDQFLTGVIIDAICHPSPDEENLIIPSSLIDNRLYNNLKRIDIGEELGDTFIHVTQDDFLEKCRIEGIDPVPMFNSLEEKVDYVERMTGKRPNIQLKKVNIA